MNKLKLAVMTLLVFAIFSNSVMAAENRIYILDMEYKKGDILFRNVSVDIGFAPDRKIQPEVGYKAEVVSFKGNALYSFKFEVSNIILPVPPREGEPIQSPIILDELNLTLIIPYFENGKAINIYDANGAKKLSVDVSRFAVGCGNEVCESGETYSNCPKDCPETALPPESLPPKGTYEEYKYYLFAGIALLLIISAFTVYRKYRKKE